MLRLTRIKSLSNGKKSQNFSDLPVQTSLFFVSGSGMALPMVTG
jgi:hypothetical protein